MFKPVTGDALSQFDPETIDLYRRRDSDPVVTLELMQLPRRARHHLPVYLDKEKNKEVVEWENQHNQFWWKMFGGAALFSNTFAFHLIQQYSIRFESVL